MNKNIILCLLATLLCSAGASATTLVFTGNSGAHQPTVFLTDSMLRVNSDDGNWILFDRNANTLFIVDDDKQSYYAIDEAQIQALGQTLGNVNAQIEQALSELPEGQRAQARALMESMMPGGGASQAAVADVVDVNFTGRSDRVAGIPCDIVETRVENTLESELCIAESDDLKITSGELSTLRALGRFAEHMLDTMQENAGSLFPDNFASGSLFEVLESGVPIRMLDKQNNELSQLDSISHEAISSNLTSIPSDYRRESFGTGF